MVTMELLLAGCDGDLTTLVQPQGFCESVEFCGSMGFYDSMGFCGSTEFCESTEFCGSMEICGSMEFCGSMGFCDSMGFCVSMEFCDSMEFCGSMGFCGSTEGAAGVPLLCWLLHSVPAGLAVAPGAVPCLGAPWEHQWELCARGKLGKTHFLGNDCAFCREFF